MLHPSVIVTNLWIHLSVCMQGYFCDGTCQDTVLETLSEKDVSRNSFFLLAFILWGLVCVDILPLFFQTNEHILQLLRETLTPPLSNWILGHTMHSGTYFFGKNSMKWVSVAIYRNIQWHKLISCAWESLVGINLWSLRLHSPPAAKKLMTTNSGTLTWKWHSYDEWAVSNWTR
jgi:hypothetical protein